MLGGSNIMKKLMGLGKQESVQQRPSSARSHASDSRRASKRVSEVDVFAVKNKPVKDLKDRGHSRTERPIC